MKIGVITDIHGNAAALKSVLNELDVDHIYCLGDMIAIGPDTNEVLEILFSRNDISMITGNHDEAVLSLIKGEEYPLSHSHAKEHHFWIAENLSEDFISKLEQLPRTINKSIEGLTILFTHYHMKPEKLMEPISKDPFSQIVEPNLENLTSLFKTHTENLICFGHHHPPHFFKNSHTIYLNPGSLGCNSKPTAPYAIVEFNKNRINIEMNETSYDNTNFLKSYERLQVPDRDFLIKAFHGNQQPHY